MEKKGRIGNLSAENGPTPGRLASLRSHDLTLGGVQKKSFAPTIPSIRKKKSGTEEAPSIKTQTESPRPQRVRFQPKVVSSKRGQLTQTSGVFSQGPVGGGTGSSSSAILANSSFMTEAKTEGDQKFKDFVGTSMEALDETSPITLPLSLPETKSSLDLFNSSATDSGELIFFQLPDTLPYSPDLAAKSELEDANLPSEGKSNLPNHQERISLKEIPEGQLGTLQILKSGKKQLKIGNVIHSLLDATPSGFLQSLAVISSEQQRLVSLGSIRHRIICTPDIESMLSEGS